MKNIIYLLLVLPIFLLGQENAKWEVIVGAEKEELPQLNDTIIDYYKGTKQVKKIKFHDGEKLTIVEFRSNGKKSRSMGFPLDDLKYKTLTKFNEEEKIVLVASYDNGIVTGHFQKFHDNGNRMEVGFYNKMKKIGIWKYFDKDGKLIKEESFD